MIVTNIIEINKSKSKIYIDHEFAFVLYKGEIYKYRIRKDEVIEKEVYDMLCTDILPKRAKLRAMNLLTKRPYTEEKLRQKLREGFYSEEMIEVALSYVKSFGYINDESYARDYISYHKDVLSRKQMEQKLLQKGIPKNILEKVMKEETFEDGETSELVQIRKLFQKKYKSTVPTDQKEYVKMLQFFMRKGYNISDIKQVISNISSLDDLYNY